MMNILESDNYQLVILKFQETHSEIQSQASPCAASRDPDVFTNFI
jgi:hypothetical protein